MTNATSTRPEDLREQMISNIRTAGHLRSERIEQAFRAVPRHRFVPAASVEEAYANKAITIKPGADRPASCISVPTVVAMMLGQLELTTPAAPWPRPATTECGWSPATAPSATRTTPPTTRSSLRNC